MLRADQADAPDPTEASEPGRGLLVLRLGDTRFGLWVDEALEIVDTPPISRLPVPDPELAGLTSVRGDLVPVLDLGRRLLGAPASRPGRLVLVLHRESEEVVGLLVDAVETITEVEDSAVEATPEAAGARLPEGVVTGVVRRDEMVVTILHVGRAAAPPEAGQTETEAT